MAPFKRFLFRDVLILLITISMWASYFFITQGLNDAATWTTTAVFHWVLGGLSGLCALLFHEWGHLYGASRVAAVVHPAPSIFSPFLFDLDSQANSQQQFVSTSVWGFYATGVFLCFFSLVLPLDVLAGRVTLGIALTLATLTVLIEFPIAWRVHKGYSIPQVEIYRRR